MIQTLSQLEFSESTNPSSLTQKDGFERLKILNENLLALTGDVVGVSRNRGWIEKKWLKKKEALDRLGLDWIVWLGPSGQVFFCNSRPTGFMRRGVNRTMTQLFIHAVRVGTHSGYWLQKESLYQIAARALHHGVSPFPEVVVFGRMASPDLFTRLKGSLLQPNPLPKVNPKARFLPKGVNRGAISLR
ncbi:MAG: hypothetical protein OEW12_08780 [Deltaproteobacteria bacterium]|nr:hypothetical protein [Deltaproteobacteria bacterium]